MAPPKYKGSCKYVESGGRLIVTMIFDMDLLSVLVKSANKRYGMTPDKWMYRLCLAELRRRKRRCKGPTKASEVRKRHYYTLKEVGLLMHYPLEQASEKARLHFKDTGLLQWSKTRHRWVIEHYRLMDYLRQFAPAESMLMGVEKYD